MIPLNKFWLAIYGVVSRFHLKIIPLTLNVPIILRLNWVKVFKNGPSKICERQPLKNFTYSILKYLDPTDMLCKSMNFFYIIGTLEVNRIIEYNWSD